MNREEASFILANIDRRVCDDELNKALDMAIKALEQEPCEDAISREAAIKAAMQDVNDRRTHGFNAGATRAANRIKLLPPVTPQPKTGRWVAYEVRLPDRTILNYRCSVCGRKLIGYSTETLSEAPFCHCGAKMVEPQVDIKEIIKRLGIKDGTYLLEAERAMYQRILAMPSVQDKSQSDIEADTESEEE